jgi:short-subunit dehydrogenase
MIIITGASDGLGKQLADLYIASGETVINISRGEHPRATNIKTDLSDPASIEQAAEAINATTAPLKLLVNCAGVMSIEDTTKLTDGEISRTFAVNVTGPMLLTSRLLGRLKQDEGDIVNVASTVGTKAYKDQAAYGSSKWAMRGFSTNLQLELKDTACRVISFCVGGFRSNISQKVTGKPIADPENWMDPKDIAQFMKQIIDLPRSMEVSEVIINRKGPN